MLQPYPQNVVGVGVRGLTSFRGYGWSPRALGDIEMLFAPER